MRQDGRGEVESTWNTSRHGDTLCGLYAAPYGRVCERPGSAAPADRCDPGAPCLSRRLSPARPRSCWAGPRAQGILEPELGADQIARFLVVADSRTCHRHDQPLMFCEERRGRPSAAVDQLDQGLTRSIPGAIEAYGRPRPAAPASVGAKNFLDHHRSLGGLPASAGSPSRYERRADILEAFHLLAAGLICFRFIVRWSC